MRSFASKKEYLQGGCEHLLMPRRLKGKSITNAGRNTDLSLSSLELPPPVLPSCISTASICCLRDELQKSCSAILSFVIIK